MVLEGEKMNLGFYVKSMSPEEGNNRKIFSLLNEGVNSNELSDASLFYDNIDYNPIQTSFGMFNSTDIWYFTGKLITTTLESTYHALQATNKFELSYLYDHDEINILPLIEISKKVNVITDTLENQRYFNRVTGVRPRLLEDFTIKSFLEVL
tara:strand:+ start:22252 stop:22707 length:456 start_codon:yes stop_codon:yes gene_type:complete